ncbi:MAG: hypothetical protein CMM54_01515 [Rhodospirillaceae bacterium]|nr:hypothetical protein [Rhodospirillaceae bacterium]|tara:strand:+ start:74 stop:376 length:303 start_codon:yes stop_codon:yes gene_type:complete
MAEIAAEHDSFGTWIAAWPEENIVDLWDTLEERFIQLGGASAPNFLRMAGNDTFIFTHDVVKALNKWDAFRGEPKGKKAVAKFKKHSTSGQARASLIGRK